MYLDAGHPIHQFGLDCAQKLRLNASDDIIRFLSILKTNRTVLLTEKY